MSQRSDPRLVLSTPGPVPSVLLVALPLAGLGWALALQAGWSLAHVLSGLGGYAIVAGLVATLATWHLGRAFGLANQITLLRAGLGCLVGGALLAHGGALALGWPLAALIASALALDALDGWLARRFGLATRFGARLDLEVDALLLLLLALLVWQSDRVEAWVLAIGLMRYAFVAAGRLVPALRAPLPPSRRRQAVCALQGVVLLACLLPPVPPSAAKMLVALALLALALSFAADLLRLLARTAPVPGRASLIDAQQRAYSVRARRA